MPAVPSLMAEIPAPLRRSWLKAQLFYREYTALSPATIRAITKNTVRMSRLDRRDRAVEADAAVPVSVGRMLSAAPLEIDGVMVGATVAYERATLEVVIVAMDLVRLSWGPDDVPVPWAIADAPDLPDPGEIAVTVEGGLAEVSTGEITVRIDSHGVSILDAGDEVRYHEYPPLRRGASRTYRRRLAPGEAMSGLGEQAGGLDLRGSTLRMWNRDPGGAWGPGQNPLYCSIPVTLSRGRSGATLAFHENSFDAEVTVGSARDDRPTEVEIRFVGGMVRTWVAVGSPASVLERYTGLTGRHPLPPRWALGMHQSRWGYRTSEMAGEVLDGFAVRDIPLSVLHLDIDYMDRYQVFTVSPDRYGDLPELADRARAHGTRLVTIVDPAVGNREDDAVYAEGIAGGHFVTESDGRVHVGTVWPGWAVFPDFTRPATRRWWASHYPRLLDQGIAGIWHDMNEPTSITLSGDRTLPRSARHDNEGRGGDHREAHNVYGMLMNRAGAEGLAAARPDRRPFIVSRSGWAGMQRYAWNWTGDVASTAPGLLQQATTFLGLGLSGVAFTGSDIGGFSGIPSPELYLRWLELGVISPFARTHSILGAPAREPWCWPEATTMQIASLMSLRYRILPYLYTLAEEASRSGAPLLRPAWWDRAGEDANLEVSTKYRVAMLGDAILCVLSAIGADTTASVEIPDGRWWRFEPVPGINGGGDDRTEVLDGGCTIDLLHRLGQPLWLVREGSIIPLDDSWAHGTRPAGGLRSDHAPGLLSFHVFADAADEATGRCFDDAGDGYGHGRRDALHLEGDVLSWESDGEFPPPEVLSVVFHGTELTGAVADGTPVSLGQIEVHGGSTTVRLGAFRRLELLR